MARPLIQIDPRQVEALAEINCTEEEIAYVMGCSVDTLDRRFAEAIKRGRAQGRCSLKRMMWSKCKEGNIGMMIWLSKQILGYRDRFEHSIEDLKRIQIMKQIEAESNLKIEDLSEVTTSKNMDSNVRKTHSKEISSN